MKEQFKKWLKIKSVVTFVFLGLTVYTAVTSLELPEWLVPIITLCFKELFDKDKLKNDITKEE